MKLCECGCGRGTAVAKVNCASRGLVKGIPARFIKGHNSRVLRNGGRRIATNGYVLIHIGRQHHLTMRNGYAYEHRLVAEQKLGRRLRRGEQVHHINENKQDNDPSNIEVVKSQRHHSVNHRRTERWKQLPEEDNPIISCLCGCGVELKRFDSHLRPRQYKRGHNMKGKSHEL